MKKAIALILVVFASLVQSMGAVLANPHLQGRAVYVPPGTPVKGTLETHLSSEYASPGQGFSMTVSNPVYAGGQMVVPPGSRAHGVVAAVEKAGRTGKPGSLELRLTNIMTPDGRTIPLSASVDKTIFTLKAKGSRTTNFAKGAGVGAAGGALSGLIGSSIGGGKKGKATAIGTGIGAGVGLLGAAFKKGNDVEIRQGTEIPFKLDQALQIAVAAPQQRNDGFGYPNSPSANPYGVSPNPQAPGGFAAPGYPQQYQQQQAAPAAYGGPSNFGAPTAPPSNPYLGH